MYEFIPRAPYNMTRIVVSVLYAFLLGSMFIDTAWRKDASWREDQAAALIGTIFLSLNVIGTLAMNMAIPVAKRVRDVFYKHRASGMIGHNAAFVGMVVAELPYLLFMAVLYVLVYCATVSSLLLKFVNLLVPLVISTIIFFFILSYFIMADWSLYYCWEFLLVCPLLLLAHGIVLFLCAMLHVPSQRRKDRRCSPGCLDWAQYFLRRFCFPAPELFKRLSCRSVDQCFEVCPRGDRIFTV